MQERHPVADLVNSLRNGNREAASELFSQFRPTAIGIAFNVTRHKQDAEDVAHDAIVVALCRLQTLHDPECFAGWFRRIVYNQAISRYRTQKKEAEYMEYNDELMPRVTRPADERHESMLAALGKLKPADSEVLKLAMEGYNGREIAKKLNVPEGTAKRRAFVARDRLREILRKNRWEF